VLYGGDELEDDLRTFTVSEDPHGCVFLHGEDETDGLLVSDLEDFKACETYGVHEAAPSV